jgi:diguanylate cyclase (GGDEF)-like protein
MARKIVLLSLAIGAIFAVVAGIGLAQSQRLAGQLDEQYRTDVVALGHMTKISQAMAGQHSAVLSHILSDPGFYRDSYSEAIAETDNTINSELATLNQLDLTPSQRNQVQSLEALLPAWRASRDSALEASAQGDRARASHVLVRSQALGEALQSRVDDIVKDLDDAVATGTRNAQASSQRTTRLMLVGLLGATAVAVTLSIRVARSTARPLREAVSVLHGVGDGDLSRRLTVDTRDEVGEMARSLNRTLDVLEDSFSTMHHRATHDSLTELANRASFRTQADEVLSRAASRGSDAALLLIDLNGFKAVNDVYGHAAGDALLVELGKRLRDNIRPTDLAARLGGDEFAVLLDGFGEGEDAHAVAARLQQAIQAPVTLDDVQLVPRASIGVAHWHDRASIEQFLHEADLAMYAAKAFSREGVDVGTHAATSPAEATAYDRTRQRWRRAT